MRKWINVFAVSLMVFMVASVSWAEFDPRQIPTDCDFTSTIETWDPDMATGDLIFRETYVKECDTPSAGEMTITVTTEERIGGVLVVTEIREGVQTETAGAFGPVYTTNFNIYDASMTLTAKEIYVYDFEGTILDTWVQEWTDLDPSDNVTAYRTKELVGTSLQDKQITYLYYDSTVQTDPVIPDEVPVLGGTSHPSLPSLVKDTSINWPPFSQINPEIYDAIVRANVNTPYEGNRWLAFYGLFAPPGYTVPAGMYIQSVLMGDRFDDVDPISGDPFDGYYHRWVRWANDDGTLVPLFGWTSDRDINEVTEEWWQARVMQFDDGSIDFIENAHRYYDSVDPNVHYDTFTTMAPPYYMITGQTTKTFTWDVDGKSYTEHGISVDGNQVQVSETMWDVEFTP